MTKTDPINWERLENMMAKLAMSQSKTDEQIQELKESQLKTDAQLAKTDAQLAKTDARLAKTDTLVTKMARMYGGLGNNIGEQAEEFFYQGFKRDPMINGVRFNEVDRNVKVHGKEYDIVMYNGKSVALLSVKHKVHPSDVEKFVEKDIPLFTEFFPQYKKYNIYGGIAGLTLDEGISEEAIEKGLFVFTQSGENPKMLNDESFQARTFH